ncbi:MAG TPA: ScpA family protein [Vitreimonas sp.]|uniref:segregation and condensation protein A n=1 Tax=Vitreimonas sp. TaxID=3069702 RepID=UPI002D710059|nr:ScpA family protein [Vitreimonas sp.]HYD86828.1 ScpA family protein [Vitreimonas sp.]
MTEADDQIELDLHAAEEADEGEALRVALDAFEGPLHVLLELARAKKIDIAKVSVTEIADQYLTFIAEARAQNMEIAGDYLVMAAWLALLKSRLLIPKPQLPADEPDPQTLEAALRQKLMNLQAARGAAKKLEELPQLGRDVFLNGQPQTTVLNKTTTWKADLYELLNAYCADRTKQIRKRAYTTFARRAYPLETARKKLEQALTKLEEWSAIEAVAPAAEASPDAPPQESYLASTFGAALELTREGRMELRQAEAFAPLFVRARPGQPRGAE